MTGLLAKLIDDRAGRTTDTVLAEQFGVSQPTFSNWRTGRCCPGPDHQRAIAEWLAISPSELRRLIAKDKAARLTEEPTDERLDRLEVELEQIRSELAELARAVAKRGRAR